jgi:hypothetical protein
MKPSTETTNIRNKKGNKIGRKKRKRRRRRKMRIRKKKI